MSHFALVRDGTVEQVIVAEQDFVNGLPVGPGEAWIQTSYNTHAGQHVLGGTPLRKNFAGVGYAYDAELDAFIPPKLYYRWILDPETCQWQPPVPYPDDGGRYIWNDHDGTWVEWNGLP